MDQVRRRDAFVPRAPAAVMGPQPPVYYFAPLRQAPIALGAPILPWGRPLQMNPSFGFQQHQYTSQPTLFHQEIQPDYYLPVAGLPGLSAPQSHQYHPRYPRGFQMAHHFQVVQVTQLVVPPPPFLPRPNFSNNSTSNAHHQFECNHGYWTRRNGHFACSGFCDMILGCYIWECYLCGILFCNSCRVGHTSRGGR